MRACALRALGRTALPDAVEFLKNFKPAPTDEDQTQQIWPASQIALREAGLTGMADAKGRSEFLQSVLNERHDAMSDFKVKYWAIEELCDAGASEALPRIRQLIRGWWSGPPRDELVAFCETRVEVIARDPDRAKALGSVFGDVVKLESDEKGRELLQWAMTQLAAIHSSSADAELERIDGQLHILKRAFPADHELSEIAGQVTELRAVRRK